MAVLRTAIQSSPCMQALPHSAGYHLGSCKPEHKHPQNRPNTAPVRLDQVRGTATHAERETAGHAPDVKLSLDCLPLVRRQQIANHPEAERPRIIEARVGVPVDLRRRRGRRRLANPGGWRCVSALFTSARAVFSNANCQSGLQAARCLPRWLCDEKGQWWRTAPCSSGCLALPETPSVASSQDRAGSRSSSRRRSA